MECVNPDCEDGAVVLYECVDRYGEIVERTAPCPECAAQDADAQEDIYDDIPY